MPRDRGSNGHRVLSSVVACIITAAWSASFLADIALADYEPHASITPLMLAVAGYLFGGEIMRGTELKVRRSDEDTSGGG
jgi:hypothetical protein